MTQDIKQGTPEWRAARVGKITGSNIGAILGVSPFSSRAKVLRTMVEESLGRISDFSNPPMQWGTENEPEAVRLYQGLYGGEVKETGFWSKGDIGASPDRLVDTFGLLEVKCPYGIRNDVSPAFKSINDLPHYWHQVQAQLYVTDREWCAFMQWTPNDHKIEIVQRDFNWLDSIGDDLAQFMEDYAEALHKASQGGPEERLAMSEAFASAMDDYAQAASEAALAKNREADAKQAILDLMKTYEVDHVDCDLGKVQKIVRKGSTKWKELAQALAGKDKLTDLESEYKGAESVSWKITPATGD